jgi:prevent-host-death family protein
MGTVVGLRELRQHASDVIRRVESGERVTVTVSGRSVAEIGPVLESTWRRYDEIAGLWVGARYGELDRDAFDESLRDPFDGAGR